jgi:hypothetical protein
MNRMKLLTILMLVLQPTISSADFGEIDILVHESIENYFEIDGRKYDITTLTYEGKPKIQGNLMEIETGLLAVQGFTQQWGLHYCVTQIKILSLGKYEDLGSDCYYDTDR